MSNLASNLTNMYVDLNQTLAAVSNASSGNTMTIPKRIPIDSAEWFKTFGRQFMDSEEFRLHYTHGDPYFYTLFVMCIVLILLGFLVIYSFCFVWVMKGNLDLPGPGGEPPKRYRVWFYNPFPALFGKASGRPRYSLDFPNEPVDRPVSKPATTTTKSAKNPSAAERGEADQEAPGPNQTENTNPDYSLAGRILSKASGFRSTSLTGKLQKFQECDMDEEPEYVEFSQ